MIKDIRIEEIMKKRLVSLHPKDDASAVKQIFEKYKIHHIPVVVNNKIVGIISLGDYIFHNKKRSKNQDKFPSFAQLGTGKVEDIILSSAKETSLPAPNS